MYLKSLEIQGFKSFAKKATLTFTSPISSIVGPNGSGKSNVAEAFRFVLGEQSIKSLRGKKGEDLIFNGSNEIPRLNRASVKVTFDNIRRFLPIDFDEVTIERVVHRDSVNEYFINNSSVRLKDVIELLAQAHIGSSGHHIISQGEADKILNASLKERRAMIEDALGLKIYQYKRQESERKLEKTAENIASVEGLCREVLPHLRFLKKQVEKVERAVVMKEDLARLYREYFKREDRYIRSNTSRLALEKEPLIHQLKDVETQLSSAKKILESSKANDTKSKEVLAIEDRIRTVRNEKDTLFRELGRIEGSIASEERIIEKQREISQSDEGRMVSMKDVVRVADEISTHIKEAEHSSDVAFIKAIMVRIKDTVFTFVTKYQMSRNDAVVEESKKHLTELLDHKKTIEKQIVSCEEKERTLQLEYTQLRQEIEREHDTNRDAERTLFTLMSSQHDILSRIQSVEQEQEKISLLKNNFTRDLQEGAALVGRSVLDFETHEVVVDPHEPRSAQEERRRAIEKIQIRIEETGGGNGEEVMKEYREVSERDLFLKRELEDLQKSSTLLRELIAELDIKITTQFKEGVAKINTQFEHFFSLMFGGGTASLHVVREKKKKKSETDIGSLVSEGEVDLVEDEEVDEGVDINVSLPRKKIKGLVMLSGGERALTSIALLFAISQVNPPPFIILDETDAALDEANSKKYGDMIENLSKYSQLILITHNRETMSRAGILYGVTMGSGGCSKLLSVEFDEAVAVAK